MLLQSVRASLCARKDARRLALAGLLDSRRGAHRLIGLVLHSPRLIRLGILVVHALAEILDALGHVAHQLRNLAASKEQQNHDEYDEPVPDRKGTHIVSLTYSRVAPDLFVFLLCFKHKYVRKMNINPDVLCI